MCFFLPTTCQGVTYNVGGRPSRASAIRIIHAAIDGGMDFLDTSDCYSRDGNDLHYVEELIAEALSTYEGSRDARRVHVGTKAGMSRTNETSRGWRPKLYTPDGKSYNPTRTPSPLPHNN